MVGAVEEKDSYLSSFERLEGSLFAKEKPWVNRLRQAAISRFSQLGFPTTRQEEWKYTSVAPLAKTRFRPANGDGYGAISDRIRAVLGESARNHIVFVNGRYAPNLSLLSHLPAGVKVRSLAEALRDDPESLAPNLARHAGYEHHAFVALNTAFMQDGALIQLSTGTVLGGPIHLLFISTTGGEPGVSHPRNLIVAGESCQATIIESYVGLGRGVYFTNAVTEIVLGENTTIDHYKLQRESEEAFHVATLQAHQGGNSIFCDHSISLGGALVRNEVNTVLSAEGAECVLNGLFLVTGRQHVDNHTSIDHVKPHGSSRELYKGILAGESSGVFDGKIIVRPDAQKTDAKQTNKNLLLSEDALINTKPQLEILANDVKCSHGSTIGQLDEDAVFYLRSRGLDSAAARGILTFAFANDLVSQIKLESIRLQTERLVRRWLLNSDCSREVV